MLRIYSREFLPQSHTGEKLGNNAFDFVDGCIPLISHINADIQERDTDIAANLSHQTAAGGHVFMSHVTRKNHTIHTIIFDDPGDIVKNVIRQAACLMKADAPEQGLPR